MKIFKSDKQEIRFYNIGTIFFLTMYIVLSIINNN